MVAVGKVLKRKDGASIVVAVIVAMIIGQVLPTLTSGLANSISGATEGQTFSSAYPGANWQTRYLQPVVWALLQLVLLELLVWLYGSAKDSMKKK